LVNAEFFLTIQTTGYETEKTNKLHIKNINLEGATSEFVNSVASDLVNKLYD